MSDIPLISVIIPCYNRAHAIGHAIDAVRQQTLSDWELVVVDDGSVDDLAAALLPYSSDPRIRLVRHARNRGEPAARNTGIAEARGRFIAFLDSDDGWMPEKLARQAEAVLAAADPERVFCLTRTIVVLSEGNRIIRPISGPAPGRSFSEFLYNDGGFAQSSSFFFAKSLALRFPFREDLRQMVDHLFFIEAGAAGAQFLLVPHPLTIWNNEERSDRLTCAEDLGKWRSIMQQFASKAGPLLPPHVMLAAEARYLSKHLWNVFPIESLRLLLRAHWHGALSTRQVVALFCRNALPSQSYNTVRHLLNVRSAARRGYRLKGA